MAKYGVREVANVVFKALAKMQVGKKTFLKNEPVLYFDTLTTTSLEGAATTSYAQGGRGNSRLMSWDGDKTLTFNMTDALISPEGLAILSGAGLVEAGQDGKVIYQHMNEIAEVENGIVKLSAEAFVDDAIEEDKNRDYAIYMMGLNDAREIISEPCYIKVGDVTEDGITVPEKLAGVNYVMVDYYVAHNSGAVEMTITPESFGGNFYIEGDTLFRRETDGMDVPAQFVIPNGKVQSNFTFTMAGTGDPSTFDFVVDAFPGYVMGGTEKVLAAIQLFDEEGVSSAEELYRDGCCIKSEAAGEEGAAADMAFGFCEDGEEKN